MKRSVLLFLSLLASTQFVWAQNYSPVPRPTALEGAVENTIEQKRNARWCRQHPEECRAQQEYRLEIEDKIEEREERQAYCDRYPERCEAIKNKERNDRAKHCELYPWKCSSD